MAVAQIAPVRSARKPVPCHYLRAGRDRQMNCGAGQATGDILLFLHADTRLPPAAFDDIIAALEDARYWVVVSMSNWTGITGC